MKRKLISTFVVLFTMVYGAKAKIVEKTVWEGSEAISWNAEAYPGTQFEAPSGTFTGLAKDDVVKIYTTTTYEDPNYVVTYKKGDGWTWTDLATTITEGVISFTVADDTQATEIAERGLILRGQAWTATKITISTEEADDPVEEGASTQLWSGTNSLGDWGNFESLRYEGKGELANAKVGDDIRVTFTNATEGWQVYVCDAASYGEFTGGYFDGSAQEEAQTVSFRIANATVLEAIQDRGIVVKGKQVTLTKIEIVTYTTSYDAVAVTIGSDGIATWSSSKKLDFSGKGITPYYASDIATGTVTLTAISDNTTWDYQGYIIEGKEGTYDIPVTETATYPETTNYLKGTSDYSQDVPRSGDGKYRYIFAKDATDGIGFYKLAETYSRVTTEKEGDNEIGTTVYYHRLAAHKAYLEISAGVSESRGLTLDFGDGTTAIWNVKEDKVDTGNVREDGVYYTLQGTRVQNPTKGLYVVNGKKVIIK